MQAIDDGTSDRNKPRHLPGLFLFVRQVLCYKILMNFIEAREDLVRSRNGFVVFPRAQSKHRHVCRYSCADADETVFNNDTIPRRDAKMFRGRQEKTRVGLPRSNLVPAEYLADEVRVKIGGLQVFLDLLPGTTGGNTEGDSERLDQSQRPVYRSKLCLKYR